jgi:Kef-type K+ transport system membrane component KefB
MWIGVLFTSMALCYVSPRLLFASETGAPNHGTTVLAVTPNFSEIDDLTTRVLLLVIQLAMILSAAKLFGWVAEMISVPGVLGELAAGMVLGPYFLGAGLSIQTHHGPVALFPKPLSRYQTAARSPDLESRLESLGVEKQSRQELIDRLGHAANDEQGKTAIRRSLDLKAVAARLQVGPEPVDPSESKTNSHPNQHARLKEQLTKGEDQDPAKAIAGFLLNGHKQQWPLSDSLWGIAVVASIVLLFITGLHTDVKQFFANLGPATVVALGGVFVPFFLGAWATMRFTDATSIWDTQPLFMGAIMVATSVGITARVLSDIRRLDTSEGVTVLAGAVVDDVIGILVLAIVVGISQAGMNGESVNTDDILATGGKAIGIWIALTVLSLVFAPVIERTFNAVNYGGARMALGLSLALLGAGIAEMFGLAFIIGAYSVGLGLSRVKLAHQLMEELEGVYHFIVPVFFACMGMLVDYSAMSSALWFGAVISFWGIVSKLVGCGAPALLWFNLRGAARIGMGMLPRGEVALIIAGVGLAKGIIPSDIFGVSIMMTLVTTVIAPIGLVPLFRGGPGRRGAKDKSWESQDVETIKVDLPGGLVAHCTHLLVRAAEVNGYSTSYEGQGIYVLSSGDKVATIRSKDSSLEIDTPDAIREEFQGFLARTEMMMIDAVEQIHQTSARKNGRSGASDETKSSNLTGN